MRNRIAIGLLILAGVYGLGDHDGETKTTAQGRLVNESPPTAPIAQPLTPELLAKVALPSETGNPAYDKSRTVDVPRSAIVSGRGVALRERSDKASKVLDRLDTGREVQVLESAAEWSKVRDVLTLREGWITSKLLKEKRATNASGGDSAKRPDKPKPAPAVPQLSESTIIQKLIQESVASYPSSCACPEDRDRAGRKCGKRSAWSKGGGYAPLCYASDVTPAMIAAFKAR